VPERGRAAAAVAEAGGGVAQVEATGEELAGGVVPAALDVEIHPGGRCGRGDLVRHPVWVSRPGVGRVVGEQVRVIVQLDADRGQGDPGLVQVAHDQRADFWVDGEPSVLMGLGVLADPLPTADDPVEGDMHHAAIEVDVAELQAAQLATAYASDDDQPQVQAEGSAVGTGFGDYLGHVFGRGGLDRLSGRGGWPEGRYPS
jgi:hypothetical protein